MARNNTLPSYASRLAARMLTTQLGRPAGVAALLSSALSEDKASSDAPLEKLEAIAKVLTVVPKSLNPEVRVSMQHQVRVVLIRALGIFQSHRTTFALPFEPTDGG